MSILNRTDMPWTCPYCDTVNTDSLESLDYEPAMCKKCNGISEVYFNVQPINIHVKGIEKPEIVHSSRETIELFIKKNGYTYKVEEILESYQKYWIQGYYTSHTMTHCIENLESEIKELIGQ